MELSLRNRQRDRAVNLPMLRRIIRRMLMEDFKEPEAQFCAHLVGSDEMARINEHYLEHKGSTDVITFDHSQGAPGDALYGEVFVSVADAVKQAREFETSWQSELARYIAHGILHLKGYDDRAAVDRRLMKKRENDLMRRIESRHDLARLDANMNSKTSK